MAGRKLLDNANMLRQLTPEGWRRDLLGKLLKGVCWLTLPVLPLGIAVTYMQHQIGVLVFALVLGAIFWVSAWTPGLAYFLRLGSFLGALSALGIVQLLVVGDMSLAHILFLAVVLLVTLFLGRRWAVASLGIIGALLLFKTVLLEGWVLAQPLDWPVLVRNWVVFMAVGGGLVLALGATLRYFEVLIEESRQHCTTLENERGSLEGRLTVMQQANLSFQRRAMYLEASIQVSQALATLFEIEPLLDQAVNLITDSFGFYHTGIFLVEDLGEWAVLRAASSAGGLRMLARGHRLRRGEESMVGWVVEHRQARVAADVGADAVHFVNPDLPATRSEVSLPLLVSGQIIGVLDVQSTEEAAFDQDDVRALQGLAGQLAIAIHNAHRMREESAMLEATSPFHRLAQRLATTRTEREIYAAIFEIVQGFNPPRAFLLRSETLGGPVLTVVEMSRGETLAVERKTEVEQVEELMAFARTLNTPLLIADVADPELPLPAQALARLAEQSESHSLALIPIVAEEVLYLLVISYSSLHTFTQVEGQLYRVLVDLARVALERIHLVRNAQRHLEEEHWMRDFGEQMMRIPNLQAVVEHAAHALKDLVDADAVMITLHPAKSASSGGSQ